MPTQSRLIMTAVIVLYAVALSSPGLAVSKNGEPEGNAKSSGADVTSPDSSQKVRMAEFRVNERRVVGRLVDEKEDSIKVMIPGSGTITFSRENVRDLKRYAVIRPLYNEKLGDYYLEQTWDFKTDEKEFARAVKAYLQAMTGASDADRKERLKGKYRGVLEQRRAWQEESVRREKLKRARAEAETAVLQEELARKKLKEVEDLSRAVKKLRSDADALYEKMSDFGDGLGRARRRLDEVEAHSSRNRRFIHRLRKDQEWLEEEVEDLEDHIGHHRHH